MATARLAFCICGIYVFFLTWGILQERITTIDYVSAVDGSTGRFRFFLLLNLTQSLACMAVAALFLLCSGQGFGPTDGHMLQAYSRVALSSCLASPFGYASLRHISYPIMILGKSCKLLPVMLMNFVIYRKTFGARKCLNVALITLGVSGFMFFDGKASTASAARAGLAPWSLALGICLLLVNLLIDGATNSWQDKIFIERRVRGTQMMFFMHALAATFTFAYLTGSPYSTELREAVAFIARFPSVARDMLLFGVCGALGQTFVFYTLEHFGSLALVTVTVTRKLFTILISLFYFDHRLTAAQWLSVSLVFVALVMEAFWKDAKGGTAVAKATASKSGSIDIYHAEVIQSPTGPKVSSKVT